MAVEERRRGPGDARANAALEVAANPRGNLWRAPIGVEPFHVQVQSPGPIPQMRIVDPALVAVDRVHQCPECGLSTLERNGFRGSVQGGGAGMLARDREVPEDEAKWQALDSRPDGGAVRTCEVHVDDRLAPLAASVVIGRALRDSGAREIRRHR